MQYDSRRIVNESIRGKNVGDGRGKKIAVITLQPNSKAEYSARNSQAKLAPPYSVLYPDTSSDSDSLKSNGAR